MQPETSSSYLGSVAIKICQPRAPQQFFFGRRREGKECGGNNGVNGTGQYFAVSREEAVLERLLVVARLEGILPCNNVVDIVASKKCHFVATVAIKDAKEGEPLGMVLGVLGVRGEEV